MKSIAVLITIIAAIRLSSCKDEGMAPPPTTDFSVKITIKTPSGAPSSGLRISAWNHLPPGVFQGTPLKSGSPAIPLSVSVINFSVATAARINLTVFECDGSTASTLVDQLLSPGLYAVHWDNPTHKPPRVYYYRLIARDTATAAILFRDSLFAVLWHTDPEIAVLGWSSSAGTFETSDKLLFPNILDLPRLVHTSAEGPDSLNTFTIPDSITIALTDTVTQRQMKFDRVITKGVANEIELIGNPILPKPRAQPHPLMAEQQSIVRTNRSATIVFDWKLYQNYPNPFN
jgi:hypothetical protein